MGQAAAWYYTTADQNVEGLPRTSGRQTQSKPNCSLWRVNSKVGDDITQNQTSWASRLRLSMRSPALVTPADAWEIPDLRVRRLLAESTSHIILSPGWWAGAPVLRIWKALGLVALR